jgi:hypothetical protein
VVKPSYGNKLDVSVDVPHDVSISNDGIIDVVAYPADYALPVRNCALTMTYPCECSLVRRKCCGLRKIVIKPVAINVYIDLSHFQPTRSKESSFQRLPVKVAITPTKDIYRKEA